MEKIYYFDTPEFDLQQREYLESKGKTVLDLSGDSMYKLRGKGFQFAAGWHTRSRYKAIEDFTGARGQVALDLNHLAMPGSNRRSLAEQQERIADSQSELAQLYLEAKMADAITYIEIVSKIYPNLPVFSQDKKDEVIFAATATQSPLGDNHVITVGFMQTKQGILVGSNNKYNKDENVYAIPVIFPVHRE